jgi:Holliday junction resolvase
MNSYAKGSRSERELVHILNDRGFATMRAPSSGGALYPLDIVAIKKGVIIAFEIKTWDRKPYLEQEQVRAFREWCEKAGAMGFLGWRGRGKWLFLRLEDVLAGNYKDERWLTMDNFLSVFAP